MRLILDGGQMLNPSCIQQRARLLDLFERSAELRTWRPYSTHHAALHGKTLMVKRVLLSGSANPTRNGYDASLFETVARTEGAELPV